MVVTPGCGAAETVESRITLEQSISGVYTLLAGSESDSRLWQLDAIGWLSLAEGRYTFEPVWGDAIDIDETAPDRPIIPCESGVYTVEHSAESGMGIDQIVLRNAISSYRYVVAYLHLMPDSHAQYGSDRVCLPPTFGLGVTSDYLADPTGRMGARGEPR
jgi:hypothetical protein